MGRLTAEVPEDDKSPSKGKTKASKKADARNKPNKQIVRHKDAKQHGSVPSNAGWFSTHADAGFLNLS
ncbi:hypothetical protein QQP08_012584 [Theobroma cacao]|nr:hypothetical protein QQP08_012399 [Theobroma cacao]WRX20097.1 hypothetical protein QQP08_012584 [Theobroma cacao]